MSMCGALWPDARAPDGRPVTCHLDAGHGGFHHRWDHENHVKPGEPFGDGCYTWHTELALTLTAGKYLKPSTVRVPVWRQLEGPTGPITHEVVRHPIQATLHTNLPAKPVRP